MNSRTRFYLACVVAVAWGVAAIAAASASIPILFAPLSLTMLLGVPLALGAITALAFGVPPRFAKQFGTRFGAQFGTRFGTQFAVMIVTWPVIAAVAAVCIGAAWQPLAWFVVILPLWLVSASAGGLLVSFVPDGMQRMAIAVLACALAAVAGPLEARYPASDVPYTEMASVTIAAPSNEVWEQVIEMQPIGSDERLLSPLPSPLPSRLPTRLASIWAQIGLPTLQSATLEAPAPGATRSAAYSGGVVVTERVTEWEDDERLRIVAKRIAPDSLLRAASRWTGFVASGAFTPFASSYDLTVAADSGTRFELSSEYRMATRMNRYLNWFAARAVGHEQVALLAVIKQRAERARLSPVPMLTAEMRYLRESVIGGAKRRYDRYGQFEHTAVLWVNGERRLEAPGDLPVPGDAEPTANGEDRLRSVLKPSGPHARTSVWMATRFGAVAADETPPARDSIRMEFEDWHGRCVREVTPIAHAPRGGLAIGTPRRSRCAVNVMAERIRRGRVLATLRLSAGDLNDHWSVAAAVRGTALVFLDSVVVRADSVGLSATALESPGQMVDSLGFGLSLGGGRSWSVVRHGTSLAVGRRFAPKDTWARKRIRFSIAADSTFELARSWPTFEVFMSLPRTADNPYGTAWTYAHAPEGFFKNVVRRLEP